MSSYLEFATQVARWDEYYAAHTDFVEQVVILATKTVVEQLVVTGHSLGGIIAEEFAAHGADFNDLTRNAYTVTFGSPGSPAPAQTSRLLNFVHTQDGVALLDNAVLNREGSTIAISRPSADLSPFAEHARNLYIDSIDELSQNCNVGLSGSGVLEYWLNNKGTYLAGGTTAMGSCRRLSCGSVYQDHQYTTRPDRHNSRRDHGTFG